MDLTIEKLLRYRNRAMASIIVDDFSGVTPQDGTEYRRFSEWVESAGVKGEVSAVLGMKRTGEGRAQPADPTFAAELARASSRHLEAFMEVMTHWSTYDFALDRIRPDGPHEGVWLNQRNRTRDEYLDYFQNIARRAQAAGFKHAGLTQPGCSCPQCLSYFYGLHLTWEAHEVNPNVALALIELSKAGQLAGPASCMFIGWCTQGPTDVYLVKEDGPYGVYDIPPGIKDDFFARARNDPKPIDITPLISADGQSGRLPEMLTLGTRTLVYFSHWHNVTPGNTDGFKAFQEVAARLNQYHANALVWLRPTEIAAYRHTERHTQLRAAPDGRSFQVTIPFEPLHKLSFRVLGSSQVRIKTPAGQTLTPVEASSGQAWTMFEFLPQTGRYEILANVS